MTSLAQYETARAALAEATRVHEVLSIHDEVEHMKLYAKQINDKALLCEAAAFQVRVEHKLGVVLAAAREAGQISEGRPKKGVENNPFPRVTLAEAGIDKNLAHRARKMGSISEQALEMMIEGVRDRIRSGRAKLIEPTAPSATAHSRIEPEESADFFPTPPWATRALIEHVFRHLRRDGQCKLQAAWDPACGEGHMAEPLAEYFRSVFASDKFSYGYSPKLIDFLDHPEKMPADWIITNPPFGDKTEPFVIQALRLTGTGAAMFVRLQWLEGVGRYTRIFKNYAPSQIAIFSERVPLHKERWLPDGDTLTAYAWLVWIKGMPPQAPFWIPPGCRESLSKPDDIERFTQSPVVKRETKAEAS